MPCRGTCHVPLHVQVNILRMCKYYGQQKQHPRFLGTPLTICKFFFKFFLYFCPCFYICLRSKFSLDVWHAFAASFTDQTELYNSFLLKWMFINSRFSIRSCDCSRLRSQIKSQRQNTEQELVNFHLLHIWWIRGPTTTFKHILCSVFLPKKQKGLWLYSQWYLHRSRYRPVWNKDEMCKKHFCLVGKARYVCVVI